jgi:hypothetical protein
VTVLIVGVEAINGVLTDTAAAAWNAALLSSSHLHLTWNYGLLGQLKPVRGVSLHKSIWPFSVAQTTTPLWSSHLCPLVLHKLLYYCGHHIFTTLQCVMAIYRFLLEAKPTEITWQKVWDVTFCIIIVCVCVYVCARTLVRALFF